MSEEKIIWGVQGRIEFEIWHNGIGTRFMLYDFNDTSYYFGFDESLPVRGPQDITYTEVFLSDIMSGGKEWTSLGRNSSSVRTKKVGDCIIVKGHDQGVETVATFNQEQFNTLTSYLTDYINTLPQKIRDNTRKFQQNKWVFYDYDKEVSV